MKTRWSSTWMPGNRRVLPHLPRLEEIATRTSSSWGSIRPAPTIPETANRRRLRPRSTESSSRTSTASAETKDPIYISDDSDDEVPPAKRRRMRSPSNAEIYQAAQTELPGCSSAERPLSPEQVVPAVLQNSVAMECKRVRGSAMYTEVGEGQVSDDDDFVTAGLYPWNAPEKRTNATHVQVDEHPDLLTRMAAMSVAEDFRRYPLSRTARAQERYVVSMDAELHELFATRTFGKCRSASSSARMSPRSNGGAYSAARPRTAYSPPSTSHCAFSATEMIYKAPGDVNTIIQMGRTVVVASAVADGAIGDNPGDYNEKGSLSVWNGQRAIILYGHSRKVARSAVHEQRHFFTVNDVAYNPTDPSRFVSAGRDNKLRFWDSTGLNGSRRSVRKRDFPDCPEVVKYQPGEATLAVQCNDGAVYIVRDDNPTSLLPLVVTQPEPNHVTADMHWGSGKTKNILFASSACLTDTSGFHKGFDIRKGKAVMSFVADNQACSTLTVDPFGETLYIATEGPDSQYTLRRYDVRHGGKRKAAEQHVDLEPFAGNPAKGETDINCLSVSSDGIYIAAGRTDNRLDVYDARMLTRGALYNFSHEDGGLAEADSYGVVKVQWVDSVPYGTGFLSGGVDGCVRLWDMKYAGDDPRNGEVLVRCDYDVATFALGNMYEGEAPIVVGERSGKVTMFGYQQPDIWD